MRVFGLKLLSESPVSDYPGFFCKIKKIIVTEQQLCHRVLDLFVISLHGKNFQQLLTPEIFRH